MGKRKAKTKPPPKKRMDKLDAVFSCPLCNHGTSVECRILQRDALPLFNMLRASYKTSIEREPAFNELLDEIVAKFYGVRRRNPLQGVFGDIFKVLGEAYQVLSDPVQRDTYDQNGKNCISRDTMLDAMAVFALLFGSELFEEYIGCDINGFF